MNNKIQVMGTETHRVRVRRYLLMTQRMKYNTLTPLTMLLL